MVDSFATQSERDQQLIRLYYDQWLRTIASLSTARALQSSLEAGGDGAVASTASALRLLKLHLVTGDAENTPSIRPPAANPSDLPNQPTYQIQLANQPTYQIQLDAPVDVTLAGVRSDLDGVIQGLETQLAVLESSIADFNREWLSGERYDGLNTAMPDESTLVDAIRTQYPELFKSGVFSTIADTAAQTSPLADIGRTQGVNLLRLAGEETLTLSDQTDAPMAEALVQLDSRLKTLQSQLEAERARNQQFVQQRDLTWDTFKTLSTKQAELVLERTAANSEVRMGTPAVTPDLPIPEVSLLLSVALAAVVGLFAATLLAFLLEFLGKKPLFTRAVTDS